MTPRSDLQDLAPAGILRGGVVVSPASSVFFAINDGNAPRGVTVDLITAFAESMKLPIALQVFPNSGELTEAVARGDCDVAFMPRDATREKLVDFGPAYYMIESTFLVPAGSPVRSLGDANFPGVRAVVIASTTTARSAARFLTDGTTQEVRTVDEMAAMAKAGDGDLFALSRDAFATLLPILPGARVLDGGFQHTGIASAVPKGRVRARRLFGDFVERAKSSGLVRRALDRAGFPDAEVAPPV
jgi:polar amino acid transport system substrate-binding protein